MSQIPQELIKKPGRAPGFVGDIIDYLYGGQKFIDPSDLIAPVGMAKIGKSGAKYIDKFVAHEGRVYDIDPEDLGNITHIQYIGKKFNQYLDDFLRKGGIRGNAHGMEYAVDAAGKPIPGKQTLNRSIQTLVRSYDERGITFKEPVWLDLFQPGGHHKAVETTIEELIRNRGQF
jgi:hypothetical protein